ncbi:MAG: c-type cytochrome [Acidimicrobiales bacterium]
MVVRPALAAVLVTLVPALVAGACSYFREPEPYRPAPSYERPDAEALALGQRLYQRDCSFCHGNEGQGTSNGPDLITGENGPALTDFMLRTGRMPIGEPDEEVRAGSSPYDDDEIAALVAYIDDAFDPPGPDIPEIDVAAGDLAAGRAVYEENCAACHATTGIGGAMLAQRGGKTTGIFIPDFARTSATEVGEAVRTGPGAMPAFGPGIIDEGELDDLARYVEYLKDPDDRGGAPIGRIGPVAEGAVGWVLGLGILVLFIRWVGTTRGERHNGRPGGARP